MTKRIIGGIFSIVIIGLLLLSITSHLLTDLWWFDTVGYQDIFMGRIFWQASVYTILFLLGMIFLVANLRKTRRVIGVALQRIPAVSDIIQDKHINLVIWIAGAIFGVMLAARYGGYWWHVAQFWQAQPFGITVPVFSQDVSFYFFTLPALNILLQIGTSLFFFGALICGAVYVGSSGLILESPARKHLGWLISGLVLVISAGSILQGYELVYSSGGALYGAGFTDLNIRLWVFRLLFVLGIGVAFGVLRYAYSNRKRILAISVVAWLGASVLLAGILPNVIQNVIVSPNEFERERQYLDYHIAMTREAYGINEFIDGPPTYGGNVTVEDLEAGEATLRNVRLWDPRPILPTYQQLQEMRPYYSITDADVDRYMIDGEYRQVLLGARELDVNRIQNPTWINQHLQYTHGYGIVMSPVNEVTRQRLPELWVYDIPPRTNVGLDVTEPRIYFGEHTDQYVIVNTKTDEFDHPMGDTNAFTRYDGKDGIYLKSFLHRLAFAMRFAESRIILSTDITQESRVLFDRNIITRAQKIAPFLRYDNDPYIVLSDGRLYWIIDAYTVSNRFPYAEPTPGWGNYIRNSVKVVVDAYQGTIDFYQVESDPLLETYANIFPGWLKPQSEMPDGLLAHLRYPEDLFVTQARMYGTYHMTDTRVFYNREDVWQFAREVYAGREQEVTPYYVVMTLPGETKEEMVLMLPFIPVGRSNMIAWLGARNDGDNYGEVQIFTFPQGALTQGPAQVEARIDQDPEISQLLTLWSQGGSQVIRGNMLVLPVGESVIYVEPFYLQSDQTSMPQLQRVIVSDQNETVIAQDLDSAMEIFMARLDSEFDVVPRPDSEEELLTPLDIDLTNQAFFIYNKAKDSLQAGDFAAFGEAWEELEIILEELNRL